MQNFLQLSVTNFCTHFVCSRNTEFFIRKAKNGGREENGQKAQKSDLASTSTFWPKRGPKMAPKRPNPRASIDLETSKRAPQSGPPFFGQKWAPKNHPKKGAAFWGCRGVDFQKSPKKDPLLPKTQTPDFLKADFRPFEKRPQKNPRATMDFWPQKKKGRRSNTCRKSTFTLTPRHLFAKKAPKPQKRAGGSLVT